MIRYLCPNCGKKYKTPDCQAGHKFACRTCGQRLQVPRPPARPEAGRSRASWARTTFVLLAGACVVTGITLGVLLIWLATAPPVAPPAPAEPLPADTDPGRSRSAEE